ncbi:hypothetical protein RQN9TF_21355 [Rhodococcus qingshengii]|jgi:hypothetical protein|nr:hypothetical protein RQN9TF_21355 [Rhodococcus qingshengii]
MGSIEIVGNVVTAVNSVGTAFFNALTELSGGTVTPK